MNKQIGDRIAADNVALIPFYGLCVSPVPSMIRVD